MRDGQPRYLAIEEWLKEQCRALPAGSLLPSEAEISAKFSVSRMTARQAVQKLASDGLVERRRGAGTFVAPPILHRREDVLLSFTEDMRRRGMTGSSRVIRAEVGVSPEDAVALGLPPSAWVVLLERVRFADGRPLAMERVALPGEFAPVLEFDLEKGSLHSALRQLDRKIAHSRGYVTARLATEEEATELELTRPAVLLVESRTIFDDQGRMVERTETAYVASRWAIDTGIYVAETAPSVDAG